MPDVTTIASVDTPQPGVAVIGVRGQITGASEGALMEAYGEATLAGARTIVLDFAGLEYMNSSGIGLLVTLLIRSQRGKQRLLASGLSDHYREIFQLTRLDEAITIYETAAEAVAASGGVS